MRGLFVVVLLAGCAAGPRPVPQGVTAAERLAFCEDVTLRAKAVGTFEIDAAGAHPAHFTGTLELTGSNAMSLVADGRFEGSPVRLEFSSMNGDIDRTVTKGPSASAQHNAAQAALNEAVVVALVRMGLLHNLAKLTADEMVSKAEGGVREEVQVTGVRDGAADMSGSEACHRVDYGLRVGGKDMGDGSLCISDSTGLPLQHRLTVHFPEGDLTDQERFTWKEK